MGLFKPDFYRSFLAGFALAATAMLVHMHDGAQGRLDQTAPSASAETLR